MQILFFFLVSLLATTVGGISGVGGGVIIKPAMDATAMFSVGTISFLSGCTVLAMTIVSMVRSIGGPVSVEPRRGTALALGSALGGIVGKELFERVRLMGGPAVSVAQQVMMILLTIGVLVYTLNRPRIHSYNVKHLLICTLIGFTLGVLSAFLGIGGGPINLAVLYFFFSMDSKTAALNSLYCILFSQGASFLYTLLGGTVPSFSPPILAVMVVGGVAGGLIGRGLSQKMSNQATDRLFLVLLVCIIVLSIYNLTQVLV